MLPQAVADLKCGYCDNYELAAFYRQRPPTRLYSLTCSHPVPLARSIDGCPILPLVRSLNANSIRDEGAIALATILRSLS